MRTRLAAAVAAALLLLVAAAAGSSPAPAEDASAAPAAAAGAATHTASARRPPQRRPRLTRQGNGLLRATTRLTGDAGVAAARRVIAPLTPAQRARFANRLAGVNPPIPDVPEVDLPTPPIGPPTTTPDGEAVGATGQLLGPDDPPRSAGQRASANGGITVFRNTVVAHGTIDGTQTSNVAEPTVSNDRNVHLFTANWYSKVSADNGMTWTPGVQAFDVFGSLPGSRALDEGFCCDQISHQVDREDTSLIFWLMQGLDPGDKTNNAFVLAVFRGKDDLVDAESIADFCAFEINPVDVGLKSKEVFDLPQMSNTDDHLYITSNVKTGGKEGTSATISAVIMRFDLADFETGGCGVDTVSWSDPTTKETLAPVQNAGDEMFFATHNQTADVFAGDQLKIYKIEDGASAARLVNVNITDFAGEGKDQLCFTVTARNPCGKNDGRITTGFRSGDTVGWLWTAAQDDDKPFPYVRVALFDDDTLDLVGERDIWNAEAALSYPAVGVNDRGEVGLVLYKLGGDERQKAFATVIENARDWSGDLGLAGLTSSPVDAFTNEWGDYGKVYPYDNCDNTFATGIWVQRDSGQFGAEHRFVWFGDRSDACIDLQAFSVIGISLDPQGPTRGGNLVVTAEIGNTGSADSGNPDIQFYLSPNKRIGPDDVEIGSQRRLLLSDGVLNAGEVFTTAGLETEIPSTIALRDGTYYLVVCIDPDDADTGEITETNNCHLDPDRPITITGGPFATVGGSRDVFDPATSSTILLGTSTGGGGGTTTPRPAPLPGTLDPGVTLRVQDVATLTATGARRSAPRPPRVTYQLSRAPVLGDDDVVSLRTRVVGTPRRLRSGRRTTFRTVRRVVIPRRIARGEWYLVTCTAPVGALAGGRSADDCRIRSTPLFIEGPDTVAGPRRARLRERA